MQAPFIRPQGEKAKPKHLDARQIAVLLDGIYIRKTDSIQMRGDPWLPAHHTKGAGINGGSLRVFLAENNEVRLATWSPEGMDPLYRSRCLDAIYDILVHCTWDAGPEPGTTVAGSDTTATAETVWRESVPAEAGIVARYLHARGVSWDIARYHPRCRASDGSWGPAMVAQMRDPTTGEPCGVHLTHIRPGKASCGCCPGHIGRTMLGRPGVVHVFSPKVFGERGPLAIAEGIESALSLRPLGIVGETTPIWAAGSAGAIASLPALDWVSELQVYGELDDASRAAATQASGRFDVLLVAPEPWMVDERPGGDWNDVLQAITLAVNEEIVADLCECDRRELGL